MVQPKEPDLRPLTPETTQAKYKLELIKRELRLFEPISTSRLLLVPKQIKRSMKRS